MLDDLDYIARFDSDNALAVAAGAHEQLTYDQRQFKIPKLGKITNIVLAGMGGSALCGLLARSWLEDELPVPFVITKGYQLPKFVNESSVVIVSSYSGNTEETLSALADAQSKKAHIFILAAEGKLAAIAKAKKYPWLQIPNGYQPRMTSGFGLALLAALFKELGFISDKTAELKAASQLLSESAQAYLPQTPTSSNPSKQLAKNLAGKSIVIYGSPLLGAAAYKWKVNFNENAKNLAFYNELPEFSHNEFIGWTAQPASKPFAVVELGSKSDHPQIKKRFALSNQLLSGKMPQPTQISAQGKTRLEQILWAVQLGDFTSIYLGILNQVNPTPVELVEKLKAEL